MTPHFHHLAAFLACAAHFISITAHGQSAVDNTQVHAPQGPMLEERKADSPAQPTYNQQQQIAGSTTPAPAPGEPDDHALPTALLVVIVVLLALCVLYVLFRFVKPLTQVTYDKLRGVEDPASPTLTELLSPSSRNRDILHAEFDHNEFRELVQSIDLGKFELIRPTTCFTTEETGHRIYGQLAVG